MKNTKVLFCLFAVLILTVAPLVCGYQTKNEQPSVEELIGKELTYPAQEQPQGVIRTAYLLIYVLKYTPEEGIQPVPGANITIRGFLRTYNGTTDELGMHLFVVRTAFFREKFYVVKVTATVDGEQVIKRGFIHIKARQIQTRGFFFMNLQDSMT